MRIAFFQNWSALGIPLAEGILRAGWDDVFLVGSAVPSLMRDRQLIQAAKRRKVPLHCPEDLLEPGFLRRLRDFGPDLLLVATYPKKIPGPLLELPRLAAVNLHPAFLPSYRGACPEFWVLRNGERETGLTLHKMTERFDAGNILGQVRIPLRQDDTMLSLTERMIQPAWDLVADLLHRYRSGERPEGLPQDPALVSRAPNVRPEHLVLRWTEPAVQLERLVRAAFPVYEIKAGFRNLEILLVQAALGPSDAPPLEPGELLPHHDRRRLLAGTGQGTLELLEVQVIHGPRLKANKFCEMYGVGPGERLEPK